MYTCTGLCYTSRRWYCCPVDNHASSRVRRSTFQQSVYRRHALRPILGDLHGPYSYRRQLVGICQVAVASEATELETPQEAADSISNLEDAKTQLARDVLTALSRYRPTGLSDGPASLTQVRPYNAAEVQQALQHGGNLLPTLNVRQLSNIAAALSAAGHLDGAFMDQLGIQAAQQLALSAAADDHVAALAELKTICYLAVAYARIGLLHVELLKRIAVRGTVLLQRHHILYPRKRIHGQHLALLAAAFAALKIQPPQLFRALGELFKQQRHVLGLLGPQESMLLLWAFARVQYKDPPAQLLLLQRATTQVGQFDCQGLAHAYTQCAAVGLTAPPLLSALRKATRQRLRGMQPQQLVAVLVALATMQQQDSLLLDELSKALHNKMANMTAAQISAIFSACSVLRYRNPWLLEQASKMLVSSKLQKAVHLSAVQLADILSGCHELQYHNNILLTHLGAVAAESLCGSWTAAELAVVMQQFHLLSFYQPQLQLSAAQRLLQLTCVHPLLACEPQQQQQQPVLDVVSFVDAAYHLASLPAAIGVATSRSAVKVAVDAVARAILQHSKHQQSAGCGLTIWIKLSMAVILAHAGQDAIEFGQRYQQKEESRAEHPNVLQELLRHLRKQLGSAQCDVQVHMGELIFLMQMLWLESVKTTDPVIESTARSAANQQPHCWQLGLSEDISQGLVHSNLQRLAAQQHHSGENLLRPLVSALQQHVHRLSGVQLVSPFLLTDSPIAVPVAVLYTADSQQEPAQGGHRGVISNTSQNSEQQQQLITVDLQTEPRRVILPVDVINLMQNRSTAGRAIAFFDSLSGPGLAAAGEGLGWFTRSEPRYLMPLAALWQHGLARAGWSVVVVQKATQSTESV